jgi:DNA-binding XRE family transcriptional regulator
MITANQLRAARALLDIDQRQMAELADLSVPTIQRMEASDGVIAKPKVARPPKQSASRTLERAR